MAIRKICLDTTFLIHFLRDKKNAVRKAEELENQGVELCTTSINAFELYLGAYNSKNPKRIEDVRDLLSDLIILNVDEKAAEKSAELLSTLTLRGEMIDVRDALIAGTILVNNCYTLVTKNVKHFKRISDLKVETY